MVESISAHVPMLVLPYFADQFDNGKIVSKEGMGLDFSNPVLTCTTEVLRSNIERLLEDHDTFASNCQRLHKSLGEAGGLEKAYKCIEDYVKAFQGHHQLTRRSSMSILEDVRTKLKNLADDTSGGKTETSLGSSWEMVSRDELTDSFHTLNSFHFED